MLENNVQQNKYQNQQFGAMSQQHGQAAYTQPQMGANPELLRENIQDSYVANRVTETTDDPKSMLKIGAIALPAWFAIAKGMDKFAEKSRGEYKDTLHYKLGNWGDTVTNNGFFQSGPMKGLNKALNSVKGFVNKNIVERFRITRAMAHTESRPELALVRAQAEGMVGILGQDYHTVAENFMKPKNFAADLAGYGADAADIARFEANLASAATPEARALEMQKAEFECLKKHSRQPGKYNHITIAQLEAATPESRLKLLNNMKAFELGFNDYNEFKTVTKSVHENLPRIMEASHNANKKMYSIAYDSKPSLLGKLKRKLFNRNVYLSEFSNKMAASLGKQAREPRWQAVLSSTGLDSNLPKTALGRILTKSHNIIMEGATNRVAGGKLAAIMQAAYLGEVIYKSAKQEGGISEKAKSFAERFAEMVAFFACMPIGLKLMHKIGGVQYAGMTPEQVKAYREALKIHNETAMSGGFADKKAWKASRDNLRKMLNAGVKNPFTKLAKRIGRIVTVGLEQIRPYDAKDIATVAADGTKTYRKTIGSKLKDLFRHPKFGMKQMAGYPLRIGIAFMMIFPFLNKLVVKGTHMIVGKPKKSILDEGKEPENPTQQQVNQTQTQLPPQLQGAQGANTPLNDNQGQTNLLNQYRQGNQSTPINKPGEPVRTYIPSPLGVQLQPTRSYVPSPMGAQIANNEDLTEANAAMLRADAVEQQALRTLKMS